MISQMQTDTMSAVQQKCMQLSTSSTDVQSRKDMFAQLTFLLQLELQVDAGGCHPPKASLMPANKTGPRGLAAAAAPTLTDSQALGQTGFSPCIPQTMCRVCGS